MRHFVPAVVFGQAFVRIQDGFDLQRPDFLITTVARHRRGDFFSVRHKEVQKRGTLWDIWGRGEPGFGGSDEAAEFVKTADFA